MKRKTLFAAFSASALLLTSVAASGSSTPAIAAVGDTVCNYWHGGDVYNVKAIQIGEREYTVSITDMKLLAFENSIDDAYVRLPLDPDLRMSTNTVSIDPRLDVSAVAASQGIQSGPPDDGSSLDWGIEAYELFPLAPWESVETSATGITWLQDMDAFSNEAGTQPSPSSYPFPWLTLDKSAGVLQFNVSIPDNLGGEVFLFDSMSASFTSSILATDTNEVVADEDISDEVAGCSVTIEAIADPDDETDPSSPDPDTPGEEPTRPVRVETAAR